MYNNQFGPRRPYPKSGIPKHYAWAPADSQHNFLHVCNHCSGLVLRDSTQDIAQRAAPYLQLVAQRLPMVCSEWITRHSYKTRIGRRGPGVPIRLQWHFHDGDRIKARMVGAWTKLSGSKALR
jgi:hypothetical protein